MKTHGKTLLAAALVLIFVGHGLAYILPPGQVLGLMMKKYRALRSLSGEGRVEVMDHEAGGRVAFPMRLYADGPHRFRVEIQARSGTRVTVINRSSGATLVDGRLLTVESKLKSAFMSIFFHRSLEKMLDDIEANGIDLMAVSLGRFLASPAYVIGAESPREPRPTIWIDKETFRPVRVVFNHDGVRAKEEVNYLDYLTLKRGVALPSVVEFLQRGGLVKRFVIKRYSLNPSLSSDLFSLKGLGRARGSR